MKEYRTTSAVKTWLGQNGISLLDFPGMDVGAVAEIRGGFPGPTVAFRADIDALPVDEQSGVEFSSEVPGVMHACGHDFHTSVMLGAAILLQRERENLHGSLRFIFQPSEETAQGAKWVVEHGALQGVEAIFGFHNRPDLPAGTIGIREGPLMASVDRFEIDIEGRGGHAGMPENCVDPIVTGAQIVTALQSVVSRSLSPLENAAVSITRMTAGNTWNVIPASARLEGTVRTLQEEARKKIPRLIGRTASGVAAANGAVSEFRWYEYLPMVRNDPRFSDVVEEAAKTEGLPVVPARQNLGGEDFAYYQSLIPGFFVWIGSDGPEEWHHPKFTVDERALSMGARFFARLGRLLLKAGDP